MSVLIDISPLIKARDMCEDMECRYCELQVRDCESMMDLLMKLPSIDAVQVKHGRWIAQKGGGYCCSECGSYSLDEVDGAFVHVSAQTRFCHNCGARMGE